MNNKVLTLLIALISLVGVGMFINVARIDKDKAEAVSGAVSPLVEYSFWLLVGVVIVAILASLWGMFKNPAALKKALLGILILGVLFLVSYFTASDAEVFGADNSLLSPKGSVSKWVGSGITYSLILGGIAGAFFVWDLLKGLVKS